jgi:hypothetical protein
MAKDQGTYATPARRDACYLNATSTATIKTMIATNASPRGDQQVRGEPEPAPIVLEPHLRVVAVAGGRVGLLRGRAEAVVGISVPEVGHGPAPSIRGRTGGRRHEHSRSGMTGWDYDRVAGTSLQAEAAVGQGQLPVGSKRAGCAGAGWLATCPRRNRRPSISGNWGCCTPSTRTLSQP